MDNFWLYFLSWLVQILFLYWEIRFIRSTRDLAGLSVRFALIFLLIFSTFWFSEGVEVDSEYSRTYSTQRSLVSAQPSHTQIEGSISGGFLFFSGVIDEKRMYLLREEVESGLYKDFTVKHEVYIREDESLTNKGKFVQVFTCHNEHVRYKWLVFTLLDTIEESCEYTRQEIMVPKGSVIKEINI